MRQLAVGEREMLGGQRLSIKGRVMKLDSDGVWRNVSSLNGYDFFDEAEWGAADDPVQDATITMRLRAGPNTGAVNISPLIGASPINRNAVNAFVPFLKENDRIRLYTAEGLPGFVPDSSPIYAWHLVFEGKIDDVNIGRYRVTLSCRDIGAFLQQASVEEETEYGTDPAPGQALEGIMQDVIDDWAQSPVSMVVPVPSGASRTRTLPDGTKFKVPVANVMEVLQGFATDIGWVARYEWGAGDTFEFRFFEPTTKPVDDAVFGPAEILDISELKISDADIRNVIKVTGFDTEGNPIEATAEDPLSIGPPNNYGRRLMVIPAEKGSGLNTVAELQRLADAALLALSTPYASHVIELPYFWPVERGDRHRYLDNSILYDSDQTMYVVGFRHRISNNGTGRTTIMARGKPVAQYKRWVNRAANGELETVPEVLFVNDATPIYGPDGFQIGWQVTGAVDSDCNSLMVELQGELALLDTTPDGFQYFPPNGTEYRIDTTTEKQFIIQLTQPAGGSGDMTLTPRSIHDTTGGGGLIGPSYTQPLARTPHTILQVNETGIITKKQLVFTVLPVNSILHYRLKRGTGDFEDWIDAPLDANGKHVIVDAFGRLTVPEIDVTQDVVVEFYATSNTGVNENKQRLTVDADNLPEFTVDVYEEPANYICIEIQPDDDVVRWRVWAREKGAENPNFVAPTKPPWPYNIYGNRPDEGRPEPDDFYSKFDGNINEKLIRFYAENGAWWVIVRGYDKYGRYQEGGGLALIGGNNDVNGTITNLQPKIVKQWPSGNLWRMGVIWQHNDAPNMGTTKVVVRENGTVVSELDRPAVKDYDDANPGVDNVGGWSREILVADPADPAAVWTTFDYQVEHRTAADGLLRVLKTSVSLWILKDGDPNTHSDPPTETPSAPFIHNSGAARSAWIEWSPLEQPAGFDTRVEWEQSFNGGIDFDPVEIGGTIVPEGTFISRRAGLSNMTLVRARIAWHNGAGDGPWSDWSSSVQIAATGPNEDF